MSPRGPDRNRLLPGHGIGPRQPHIGDLVDRPLDDPTVLAAGLRHAGDPDDRAVLLGQRLMDEMVPAQLALKLAANRQQVTFRTYPTGHIETRRAALPEPLLRRLAAFTT